MQTAPAHARPFAQDAPAVPISLLRAQGQERRPPSPDLDSEPAQGGSGGAALVCRACRRRITTRAARTFRSGAHSHVFSNPHGLVFEIGCFTMAACLRVGPPSLEFTWFPGLAWQVAACPGCRGHLGWFFQGASGDGFWGLILDRLDEEEEDQGGQG